MSTRIMVAVLVACQVFLSASPVFAQGASGLLSWSEKRAYHACLYAVWIDDYCRTHAWGFSDRAFRECVIANGGHLQLDDVLCHARFPDRHL